jgi:hypothetical protein
MKTLKPVSVEDLQLSSRFQALRRILLSEEHAAHREKPLAYWALPNDRRLPLALLGRTLGELLNTPYAELAATPGIGQKKMRSFVKLLGRVVNTDPAPPPDDPEAASANGKPGPAGAAGSDRFDPSAVSELVWAQWRASVVRHGLVHEPLGRLAPSLKNIARVIWNRPLGAYTGKTLAEICAMKTHGEKRVRAILEVFHGVHAATSQIQTQGHLVVRLVPRLIDSVQTWIGQTLRRPGIPSEDEIFVRFVSPLLKQVRCDGSRRVVHLAENRLGIHGPVTSIREAARALGLTRARIYQLLNEISELVAVRWPLGRQQVEELCDVFQARLASADPVPSLEQFYAAVELLYPGSRRGAVGDQAPAHTRTRATSHSTVATISSKQAHSNGEWGAC